MDFAATASNGTQGWDAIAALSAAGTFVVALAAIVVAWRQLRATRETRLDQTRPYVMVTIEQGINWFQFLDIMVVNVGAGPARDVRIAVDPALERSYDEKEGGDPVSEARYFKEPIPVLPPGYKLRTFFDDYTRRYEREMPSVFTFTVSYHDGHGNKWNETIVQDLGLMNDLQFTETFGMHHAAKALRELSSALKDAPIVKGKPVDVTIEDRAVRVDRVRREHEERERRMEELSRRLTGQPGNDSASDDSP